MNAALLLEPPEASVPRPGCLSASMGRLECQSPTVR